MVGETLHQAAYSPERLALRVFSSPQSASGGSEASTLVLEIKVSSLRWLMQVWAGNMPGRRDTPFDGCRPASAMRLLGV